MDWRHIVCVPKNSSSRYPLLKCKSSHLREPRILFSMSGQPRTRAAMAGTAGPAPDCHGNLTAQFSYVAVSRYPRITYFQIRRCEKALGPRYGGFLRTADTGVPRSPCPRWLFHHTEGLVSYPRDSASRRRLAPLSEPTCKRCSYCNQPIILHKWKKALMSFVLADVSAHPS